MLTYTITNDRIRLQYDGVDLKCRWKSEPFIDSFKSDFYKSVEHEIYTLINWEVFAVKYNDYTVVNPPDVLTEKDKETINDLLHRTAIRKKK